mmetsp:Transcript_2199/g.6004  ORF Transcript_2199/g.6004 Transcript_2199/m.6004 type:complete len:339 (-) Transcript_2199:518-1534(-)
MLDLAADNSNENPVLVHVVHGVFGDAEPGHESLCPAPGYLSRLLPHVVIRSKQVDGKRLARHSFDLLDLRPYLLDGQRSCAKASETSSLAHFGSEPRPRNPPHPCGHDGVPHSQERGKGRGREVSTPARGWGEAGSALRDFCGPPEDGNSLVGESSPVPLHEGPRHAVDLPVLSTPSQKLVVGFHDGKHGWSLPGRTCAQQATVGVDVHLLAFLHALHGLLHPRTARAVWAQADLLERRDESDRKAVVKAKPPQLIDRSNVGLPHCPPGCQVDWNRVGTNVLALRHQGARSFPDSKDGDAHVQQPPLGDKLVGANENHCSPVSSLRALEEVRVLRHPG